MTSSKTSLNYYLVNLRDVINELTENAILPSTSSGIGLQEKIKYSEGSEVGCIPSLNGIQISNGVWFSNGF